MTDLGVVILGGSKAHSCDRAVTVDVDVGNAKSSRGKTPQSSSIGPVTGAVGSGLGDALTEADFLARLRF